MSIVLYTQPDCPFCDIMKEMLDKTGLTYYTSNIKNDIKALNFIKDKGHQTVPQLYVDDIHINKKPDTRDYTSEELYKLIDEAMSQDWPWADSGIEQGI